MAAPESEIDAPQQIFRTLSRKLAAVELGAVVLTWAALESVALAEPIRLQYAAPPDCPGPAVFQARVAERLTRGALANSSELARVYAIRIERHANGYAATLEFMNAAGDRSRSNVGAETCGEVFDAAVVTTALAIDSNAEPAPAPKSDSSPAAAAEPTLPPARAHPAPPAPSVAPPVLAPGSPSRFSLPAVADNHRPARPPASHLAIGAELGLHSGFAPKPAPGGGAFVEARDRGGWAARLGVSYANSGQHQRSARFSLVAAFVDGCLPPLGLEPAELSFCATAEAGALRAEGANVAVAVAEWTAWLAPGAGPRLELTLGSELALFARSEVLVPVIRERFEYQNPRVVIHEVPVLTWSAALGASYRFR